MPLSREELSQAVLDLIPADGTRVSYHAFYEALASVGEAGAYDQYRLLKARGLVKSQVRYDEATNSTTHEIWRPQ